MEIRPQEPSDLPALLEWRGRNEATCRAIEREVAEHFEGLRLILLGFEEGRLAATAQLVFGHRDPDLAGAGTAYVQALEVHSERRRKGLGLLLRGQLEGLAKARRFSHLTLMVEPDNRPALELYAKLGYSHLEETLDVWDGRTYPVWAMQKRI